jgi:hypothetical protein
MDAFSLHQIAVRLDRLIEIGEAVMAHFERLQAEVARSVTVKESAIVLLNQIVAELRALKELGEITPEQVEALADQLAAKTDELADAVVAGTDADDEEPVDPVEP